MEFMWDNEKIFKLIELYQARRILWDNLNKDYKNKIKKNEAWEDISKTLEIPKSDVETKIHTLRTQFTREKKRIMLSKTAKSRWMFFNPLKFLWGMGITSGSGSLNTTNKGVDVHKKPTPKTPQTPSPVRFQPEPFEESNQTAKRKVGEISEIFEIVKKAKILDEPKDEFDIYGQYVASELRVVKNEYAALQAKSFINNILIEVRMGKYNQGNDDGPRYETTRTAHTYANGLEQALTEGLEETNSYIKSERVHGLLPKIT